MAAMHGGDTALEISFAKEIVLEDLDRRGLRVGIEIIGVVANHSAKIGHHVGRKRVLVADDAHGFDIVGGLALPGGLLQQFVGNVVARNLMPDRQVQAIVRREIALITQRKIAERSGIGKILGHHRIEIVVGHAAAGAGAQSIISPDVLPLGEGAGRIKTSAGEHHLPVKSGVGILQRVHFHDAAQLAPVFRGNARGVDAHRLHVVRFDLGTEARRAIVRERNAVDHELRLVFRAARMQHGVAFIEPARLGVHQILQRTPGDRTEAVLNRVGADLADCAGLIGIDQGVGSGDGNGLIHGGQLELDHKFGGNRGTNLDHFRNRSESGLRNFQPIQAVRQALYLQPPLLAGAERILILVGVTRQRDSDFHPETSRIGNL